MIFGHQTVLRQLALLLLFMVCACKEQDRPVIERLDQAGEARLGVMTGSTGEVAARKRYPKAEIKTFDDIMDAVTALNAGQLDAIITIYPTALQVAKKNPRFHILEERLDYEDTSAAVRKDNTELLKQIDTVIGQLKADGTMADMERRWLKPDLSPYEELDIKLPKTGLPLRVGVSATREPMSFVDATGRITGHDGELARLIAARLNRPVEFYNMKFLALIPALQSGKIDVIISGMTHTAERAKKVNFTRTYYANSQVMLAPRPDVPASSAPANSAAAMAGPQDIADKRIAVLTSSVQDRYATRHYPNAKVLQFDTVSDVVMALKAGKADVALYDENPLRDVLRKNPEFGLLGKPLFSLPMGVGFSKQRANLRAAYDRWLAEIRADGTYDAMKRRWMDEQATALPPLPQGGGRGTLVVGTMSAGYPFVAVHNGQLVGFDIEMIRRFAASQDMAVRFADMQFGALIPALAAGKVDMIAASIAITDERKQQIDFGTPYFHEQVYAFARKDRIVGGDGTVPQASAKPQGFLTRTADSFRTNILQENRYRLILDGLATTVVIAILATIFGTLLGGLVCFMRMSSRAILNVPARMYIAVLRGMPVLVLLMLIFYVVFASVDISPVLVAVIAFGLNFAAYATEIYRTGISGIDKGQSEAGIAMGFTRLQTFRYIILPQTIQRILPVYKGEFISLVKMTSIVGYIAVQDLTKASDIIRSRTFDAFFPLIMVAILYFLIAWVLMQAIEYLERKTDPKSRRRENRQKAEVRA